MAQTIQLRRGLASQWTTKNPVLAQGEVGLETDTNKIKFGDGTTAWNSLPYVAGLNGADGADGANGSDGADGQDGREIELQKSATHIQWRYVGDPTWIDLVSLTDITGPAGADGANGTNGTDGTDGREIELQKNATHIQWRYVGDPTWTDLVPLSDITGPQGPAGNDGADGADGADGVIAPLKYQKVIDEDFVSPTITGDYNWTAQAISGGTTPARQTAENSATEWGVIQCLSGTATGVGSGVHLGVSGFVMGAATVETSIKIRVPTLFDVANNGTMRFGFGDLITGEPNNGIYFEHNPDAVGSNWRICQCNAGTRTRTDSGVTITSGASYLELRLMIGTTSTQFFVGSTSLGTISTNFPTGQMSPFFAILKGNAGTTQRVFYVDWFYMNAEWPLGRV